MKTLNEYALPQSIACGETTINDMAVIAAYFKKHGYQLVMIFNDAVAHGPCEYLVRFFREMGDTLELCDALVEVMGRVEIIKVSIIAVEPKTKAA